LLFIPKEAVTVGPNPSYLPLISIDTLEAKSFEDVMVSDLIVPSYPSILAGSAL
jgi:hypothetical protein